MTRMLLAALAALFTVLAGPAAADAIDAADRAVTAYRKGGGLAMFQVERACWKRATRGTAFECVQQVMANMIVDLAAQQKEGRGPLTSYLPPTVESRMRAEMGRLGMTEAEMKQATDVAAGSSQQIQAALLDSGF